MFLLNETADITYMKDCNGKLLINFCIGETEPFFPSDLTTCFLKSFNLYIISECSLGGGALTTDDTHEQGNTANHLEKWSINLGLPNRLTKFSAFLDPTLPRD